MLTANAASVVDSADAGQLPALIAEWEAATDERLWLARALRVDLALLTELPDLALVCLARRCMYDPVWYASPPGTPPEAVCAAELAERWASGTRRLRAVRPPPVPLVGGVLEEYRTSLRGELCGSGDGAQLGILGDDATISWDRASGRRTDRKASAAHSGAWSPLLPSLVPGWKIGAGNTWQQCVLESEAGAQVAIDLGADVIARAVRVLDDDRAIVELDDAEHEARHCLVQLSAARVAWTADEDCRAAALAGAHVVCGGHRGVTLRDAATGDEVARVLGPMVDAIAILRGGAIATRSGAVIRVWDRGAPGGEQTGTYGWTSAAFSPADDRLVTGGNLCDGRTGARLAHLRVNGPGWLEGGPPLPCQALVDGAFVELQPMGLRVWDARDGQLRVEDRGQTARHLDVIAFDPRGRYYALAQHKTGKLAIRALADGATLWSRIVPLVIRDALGFTHDGAQLWWHASDGTRWIAPVARDAPARLLAVHEPTPATRPPAPIAVRDGLLVVGDLVAPCDDAEVIASHDGRAFASRRCHYVIEA